MNPYHEITCDDSRRYCGFFTSIVFTFLLLFLVYSTSWGIYTQIFSRVGPSSFEHTVGYDKGFKISFGVLSTVAWTITAPVLLFLLFTYIKKCKKVQVKDYLCLKNVDKKEFSLWLLLFGCINIFAILLAKYFPGIIPFHERSAYLFNTIDFGSSFFPNLDFPSVSIFYYNPFFYIAFLFFIPVFEEVLFRGFLFRGIRSTKLGPIGAIVITTIIFALFHEQNSFTYIVSLFYGKGNFSIILLYGMIFGIAREKTGSLYVPIGMHILGSIIFVFSGLFY